jgi:hypothetical protein
MSALEHLRQGYRIATVCSRALLNAWFVAEDLYDRRRHARSWRRSGHHGLRLATSAATVTLAEPSPRVSPS